MIDSIYGTSLICLFLNCVNHEILLGKSAIYDNHRSNINTIMDQ